MRLALIGLFLMTACAPVSLPTSLPACTPELPPYTPSESSGFVAIQDGHFVIDDAPYPVHGINYYPARYPWRRFLTEADLAVIRTELDLLRSTGFNTLRLFLWNGALFACPESRAGEAFSRLDAIIHEAAAHNFRLIITLNDLPDVALYTSHNHTQTRFIIERYRDEATIMAWDLRNEGDIDYGSQNWFMARFSRLQVLDWLAETSEFVRQLDGHHLITAGWLNDSQSTIPAVDFVSFHHWGDAATLSRRILALRDYTDKPILLEEFGYSTYTMTPEEQSARIQQVIETATSHKLAGWLIWTAFDFPLDSTCWPSPCTSTDNAEHHFGLWYSDYTPKLAITMIQTLRHE
jgi:endo-1,4-beta-mannosidase